MSSIIGIRIDLNKVDKSRLFTSARGALYLDATLFVNDEPDKFGQCGMIVQQVTKDERANGVKGNILGNGKIIYGEGKPRLKTESEPEHISKVVKKATENQDDIPF